MLSEVFMLLPPGGKNEEHAVLAVSVYLYAASLGCPLKAYKSLIE